MLFAHVIHAHMIRLGLPPHKTGGLMHMSGFSHGRDAQQHVRLHHDDGRR